MPAYDPEATTPRNFTGGLYASDLFLAYYVPLIEESSAYAHGGLIDITFDEGEPNFTYSGNTFNNVLTNSSVVSGSPAMPAGQGTSSPQTSAPADAPSYGTAGSTDPGADLIFGADSILGDTAGENIGGTNVSVEPTGPNSPLQTDGSGRQQFPGPGFNLDVDRPPTCTQTTPALVPADCEPGIVRGDSGSSPGPRTDTVTGGGGSSTVSYPAPSSGNPVLVGDDTGREVTSVTINGTAVAIGSSAYTSEFPNGLFVGTVSDTGELYPTNSSGPTVAASFQAIDDAGNPVGIAGSVTSVTLSGEGDPAMLSTLSTPTAPVTADPLFDATDPTNGGGDTGSVLISPFIAPGSVSTTFYNHYSWLRTMEDVFDVSNCVGTSTDVSLPTGSVCGGLDGQGHIGYAAADRARAVRDRCLHCPERRRLHAPHPHQPWGRAPRGAAGRGAPGLRRAPHGRLPGAAPPQEPGHHGMTAAVAPTADAPTDRASRPGPSSTRRVLFWVVFVGLAAAMAWGIYGLTSTPGRNIADPQSWLPKQQLDHPIDQTVVGTLARPALTVEGDFVRVQTPTFSALAVATARWCPAKGCPSSRSSPPAHGRSRSATCAAPSRSAWPTSTPSTTCRMVYTPTLVPGQQPLPAALHTGQSLSFKIRSVMPVGEGLLRWAPDGDHIVAKWDYQVEND